jgi:hypothetical protein
MELDTILFEGALLQIFRVAKYCRYITAYYSTSLFRDLDLVTALSNHALLLLFPIVRLHWHSHRTDDHSGCGRNLEFPGEIVSTQAVYAQASGPRPSKDPQTLSS